MSWEGGSVPVARHAEVLSIAGYYFGGRAVMKKSYT